MSPSLDRVFVLADALGSDLGNLSARALCPFGKNGFAIPIAFEAAALNG
jgi:hypothetical protein